VRRRKDGTLLDVSLTISPVRDATGRVVGASKVARDITAQVRTEQALRQSEERFRRLSESLDAEVRARTHELEDRNVDVLRQSEQLRDLSRRLLKAQDQERRRIARELHDSAGQTLTVLGIDLAQLSQRIPATNTELSKQIHQAEELVQKLHQEIRTMSYLLHPPLLDETGLAPALSWYVEGLTSRSGLQISLSISDDFDRLPREMELVVFRVVQECLTNIHRHSGSRKAAIRIERDGTMLTVEVQDYGRGISPEKMAELHTRSAGLGIRGMRERVRQLEGELQVESSSSGTLVHVTIPLPRTMREEERVETFRAAS
jgi:signal transduction histidine kinase